MTTTTTPNPNPLAPSIQTRWEEVLHVNDIIEMGTQLGKGLRLPFILDAFAPIENPKYACVLEIVCGVINGCRMDKMICGNVQILIQQPQPPPTPILFFLFRRMIGLTT